MYAADTLCKRSGDTADDSVSKVFELQLRMNLYSAVKYWNEEE